MKFKMNNCEYIIKEVSQEELKKEVVDEGDDYYYGVTIFSIQTIFIDKDLLYGRKRKTLYHELMHVYIREYLTTKDIEPNEEAMCDLSANSHDIIHKIVEDYFNKRKEEIKILEEENKRLEEDLERLKNNSLMAKTPKTYRNLEDFNVGDYISDFFKK